MTRPRLKVLQVGKYYPPHRGGMETVLEMLCLQLKDRVDLTVVVAADGRRSSEEVVEGVAVQRLGTALKLAGAPITLGLWKVLRNTTAEIIHIHTPHPFALFFYLLAGSPGKLVIWYHSDIVRQKFLERLIRPLQEAAMRRAGAIIVSSQQMIENSPVLRRHRDRCVVVPFGLQQQETAEAMEAEAAAVQERFGPLILLAVGRLVYYKGFAVAIQAMVEVASPAKLLIIGEGPDREMLEEEIRRLNLTDRVFLLGNVPETVPYFVACDLFILPSVAKSEAFGIVQLEAMAQGKPVINTWLDSGVPSVSLDGKTGITVPPSDSAALAAAINRLIEDRELRERYGRAARQRFLEEFTAEKMAERVLGVYQACAA